MRSICFFSSYFNQPVIPYYIKYYLENLLPHFSEIVFITNEKRLDDKSLDFLKGKNISLVYVLNEGFDFGMWYKAFQKYDLNKYKKIALVNDSCVLVTSLEKFMSWTDNDDSEYIGVSESLAISRHLQSYFIIIKNGAIPLMADYFVQTGILSNINDVIAKYEIGLSSYLLNKGIKINSFVDNGDYSGEFSPYYYLIESHIKQGIPLIKKKIIFASYRKDEQLTLARMNFNINSNYYIELIKKYNDVNFIIDFKKVKSDFENEMNFWDTFIYNLKRVLILFGRPIYNRIKF